MAAEHHDPMHHVMDAEYLEFPGAGYFPIEGLDHNRWYLPHFDIPGYGDFQVTKFMLLQVVAGLLTMLIFFVLALKARKGEPVRGRFWNFWEAIALYLRDQVVRPTIGTGHHHGHADDYPDEPYSPVMYSEADEDVVHGVKDPAHATHGAHAHSHTHVHADGSVAVEAGHPADQYLPFIWTCFFYVLFCNLLGAFPWLGSATGNINVTVPLALTVMAYVIFVGSKTSGVVGYWKSLAPSVDVPGFLKYLLIPMIWIIEFFGLLIKHGVLAVRLFANIMAGHTVIAFILGFIAMTAHSGWFYAVAPASVLGQVGIGLLELFVAFLQAYVFAFLATLFISAAVHPH